MIKGVIPASLIDWEGDICSVIFTGGCNYGCPFCHNPELIEKDGISSIKEEDVIAMLERKRNGLTVYALPAESLLFIRN